MTVTTHKPLRKPSCYLGLSAWVVGAIFLFDPFMGVFDFLPDAIGYLLIALALYRFSDMDDRLSDASRAAGKLALLGAARQVAMLLTYALVSPTERPVFILLMVFSLGVLDVLMFIPLWRNIAAGFTYLGSRVDAVAVFDRTRRGGRLHLRPLCERYAAFSIIYFVCKETLAVLPEVSVLTHERGGTEWGGNSLYNFIGLLRMAAILVSMVLGIVWLVKTIGFIRKLKADKPFIASLHRKYETEVLIRRDLFAMRAVKASLVSLSAAAVLSLDLYVEGVSIMPDLLAAVLMILSIRFLARYTEKRMVAPPLLLSVLYGLLATIAWVMQFTYFSFNDLPDVRREPTLQDKLPTVTAVHIATSLLFLGAFLLILRLLYALVREHTGIRALRDGSAYAADRTEAIHSRIRRKLLWVAVFAALSALSAVLLWGVVPHMEPIDLPLRPATGEALLVMLYDAVREAYWGIDLLIGGVLVALTIHANLEIFEQMDYTYLMN